MSDHASRMYSQALDRLHDADILSQSLDKQSDSDSFIRILGFEVLLKCAALLSLGEIPRLAHNYFELWKRLPDEVKNEVLQVALQRMPGHADLSQIEVLLKAYEFVFKKARYYYEFYEDCTSEDVRAIGDAWLKNGARIEDATVVYYPNELVCLIEGLSSFIEARLET